MKTRLTPIILITVLVLALAAPLTIFAYGKGEAPTDQGMAQAPSSTAKSTDSTKFEAPKSLAAIQYSFREVAQKVLPIVVEVNVTEQMQANQQAVNPFEWFFNQQPGNSGKNSQPRVQTGLGSGIIVKKTGNTYYVLTNNHVVDTATTISVKLFDQTVFDKVKVVGKDARRDLAVLSFTSSANLPVADLGDSAELQVGDLVLAVGNPFGFENTVTMGIISAVGRNSPSSSITDYTDYIQTDAAINQGNSGGALVNITGEVIGINTWIAAPTGGSIGLGFAVPINNAKQAINDFISKGKVEYGWLGVSPQDPDADSFPGVAKDLKIEKVKGALVLNVFRGSPAEKSGLQVGDYITSVNGQEITNTTKLIRVVGDLVANRSYDFEVIRYGERVKLSIKLGARPSDGSEDSSYKNMWPGIKVLHINEQVRQQAQAEGDSNVPSGVDGVMIGYVATGNTPADQSPAAVAGFRSYDIITSINGKDIHTVMDFYRALNDKSKRELVFRINRQGTDIMIGLVR